MKTLDPSRYPKSIKQLEKAVKDIEKLVSKKQEQIPEDSLGPIAIHARRFEMIDPTNNHNKFWEITLFERSYRVYYGRIGTKGSFKDKVFTIPWIANDEYNKIINEKVRKGYRETLPWEN